jgi:hypothetical protein
LETRHPLRASQASCGRPRDAAALVADASDKAARRFASFFGSTANDNTRAAIRTLFDYLVAGRVVVLNPAHAVLGPKHVIKRGKTTVLTPDDARRGRCPSSSSTTPRIKAGRAALHSARTRCRCPPELSGRT